MKKVFFTVLALICTGISVGQDYLINVQTLKSDASIVRRRNSSTNTYVLYSTYLGTPYFCLADCDNYIATKCSFLSGASINDMEVVDDRLYFCGNYQGSALFGWFNIDSFFYKASVPYFYYRDISNTHVGSVQAYYTNALKMDVFHTSDGVQMYMICETSWKGMNVRTVINAHTNMPYNTWSLDELVDTCQIDYFSDVAVTDNYIVVVGQKYSGDGFYMHTVSKPTTYNSGLIQPLTYNEFKNINWITGSQSDPLIEHVYGNTLAISYYTHGMVKENPSADVVTVTANNPYLPATWIVHKKLYHGSTFDPNWSMSELKYLPSNNQHYIVQNMQTTLYSNNTHALYQYDLSGITPNVYEYSDNSHQWLSADRASDDRLIVSGYTKDNVLSLWLCNPQNETCIPSGYENYTDEKLQPAHSQQETTKEKSDDVRISKTKCERISYEMKIECNNVIK